MKKTLAAKTSNVDLGFDFDDIGSMHNDGLTYVIGQLALLNHPTKSQYATAMANATIGYRSSEYPGVFSLAEDTGYKLILAASFVSNHFGNVSAMWSDSEDGIEGHISTKEQGYFDNIKDMFETAETMSSIYSQDSIFGYLIATTHTMIINYESDTWSSGSDGDLVGGMLYIANSSAHYWRTYPTTPIDPAEMLVQADAAGYLYGWAKAWLYDQLPNADDRIHAGWSMALDCSAFSGAVRFF